MNGHNERGQEIKALRACISRLGEADLRISESPDLATALREALKPHGQGGCRRISAEGWG